MEREEIRRGRGGDDEHLAIVRHMQRHRLRLQQLRPLEPKTRVEGSARFRTGLLLPRREDKAMPDARRGRSPVRRVRGCHHLVGVPSTRAGGRIVSNGLLELPRVVGAVAIGRVRAVASHQDHANVSARRRRGFAFQLVFLAPHMREGNGTVWRVWNLSMPMLRPRR
jgi:hypothetical protein